LSSFPASSSSTWCSLNICTLSSRPCMHANWNALVLLPIMHEGGSRSKRPVLVRLSKKKQRRRRWRSWHGIRGKCMHVRLPKSMHRLAGGRSEIQASKGSDMLRSPSKQIEANHYIEYLYYFLYEALSSSTPLDTFLTGVLILCPAGMC
jgi:hypothetical protein